MKNRNAFEDKSEKYKKELFDCLRKKRGFFFTGSGISIESGIAKNSLSFQSYYLAVEFFPRKSAESPHIHTEYYLQCDPSRRH